jgi:hypothetical protein
MQPFSCNFWCCLLCPSMLPSLSLRLVSEVQLPGPTSMPTNSMPFALGGTAPPTSRIFCKSTGCHSTRIRKGCDRRMCKAHCIEAGGCSQPPHKGSQPPQASASDNISLPPPPPPPSHHAFSISSAPHTASPSQLLMNMPTPAPLRLSQPVIVDPALLGQQVPSIPRPPPFSTRHAGPAFSSHMSDIFTKQMVDAQRQWEKNGHRDIVRIQSQEKAKQTVFVFPFLEVSFL